MTDNSDLRFLDNQDKLTLIRGKGSLQGVDGSWDSFCNPEVGFLDASTTLKGMKLTVLAESALAVAG
jgi:hypothetical protein